MFSFLVCFKFGSKISAASNRPRRFWKLISGIIKIHSGRLSSNRRSPKLDRSKRASYSAHLAARRPRSVRAFSQK